MRGQSEAVGLAIIVALVIGSIVAYSVLSPDEPTREPDRIIAENFAYALLTSEVELSCGNLSRWRVIEYAADGLDPCSTGPADPDLLTETVENVTRYLEEWGHPYELTISTDDGSSTPYPKHGDCGFERSGVARYPFGRDPGYVLEFSLCS